MRKNTALSWANSISISEKEFNDCLVTVGYQQYNSSKRKWELTTKGKEHGIRILGKIYWDIDAHFEVMKLRGKQTRKYFYCDKCGAYNRIVEENKDDRRFLCCRCGNETLI